MVGKIEKPFRKTTIHLSGSITIHLLPMRIPIPLLLPPSPTKFEPFTTLSQSKAFKPHTPSLQLPFATTLLQQTVIQ
jgi:hypothetical protein